MSENKTKPTSANAAEFLAAIGDDQRRADCRALSGIMQEITGEPAVMWGAGIVGFGSCHYRYESGREGDWAVAGFSPRKGDISVYLMAEAPEQAELLSRLGRHKMGKACLYIRKLADVDVAVLAQLVADSVAEVKRRHGQSQVGLTKEARPEQS